MTPKRPVSAPRSALKMTDFTRKVMVTVKKIPRGKVATYGQIARLAGKPGGARGVGWILNSMSELHDLPWQRVLNSQGKISFKPKSEEHRLQKRLLVRFLNQSALDLAKYQWKRDQKPRTPRGKPQMFR